MMFVMSTLAEIEEAGAKLPEEKRYFRFSYAKRRRTDVVGRSAGIRPGSRRLQAGLTRLTTLLRRIREGFAAPAVSMTCEIARSGR